MNVPTDLTPMCTLLLTLPSQIHEAQEETVLQGALQVQVCLTSKRTCSSTVVNIEQPTLQGYGYQ